MFFFIGSWIKSLLRLSNRVLLALIGLGYSLFFVIIGFVFIPTGAEIDATGYSIIQFQNAGSAEEMDTILSAWSSINNTVIYQLWADYIFITAGFIANFFIFLILAKNLRGSWNKITYVGMIATFLSQVSDGIENVFGLLIVYNPENFDPMFVTLQNFFATLKFMLIPVVYGLMLLGIGLFILQFIRKK